MGSRVKRGGEANCEHGAGREGKGGPFIHVKRQPRLRSRVPLTKVAAGWAKAASEAERVAAERGARAAGGAVAAGCKAWREGVGSSGRCGFVSRQHSRSKAGASSTLI